MRLVRRRAEYVIPRPATDDGGFDLADGKRHLAALGAAHHQVMPGREPRGEVQEGAPVFSYALQEGVSDKRFGLLLLHEAEIPELIAQIPA